MWSKIAQVFSFGDQWGRDAVRLVEGNNASEMLKRVEEILEDSMRLLSSHERVMAEREFTTFSIKHRHLVLKVVEVKHQVNEQKSRSAFSASPAGIQPFRLDQEVIQLSRQAQIYHSDLLTASRRAQIAEEERFLGRYSIHPHEDSLQTELPDPTTWYSVVSYKSSTDSLSVSETGSDAATLVNREPYLALVHVRPAEAGSSEGSTDDSYRQILITESSDKTVIMINPNRCHPNKEPDPLNESTLLEMSRASEALLRATDPGSLQGYEVDNTQQHETSWVDSFVHTLSRLGVGIGADMM